MVISTAVHVNVVWKKEVMENARMSMRRSL